MVVALIAVIGSIAFIGAALVVRQIAIGRPWRPSAEMLVLGAVTNFFDTLGIGSFAPTMAWFRFRGLVADRAIPPTMYVGHGLPSILQAILFLALFGARIDPWLLAACVMAMFAGAMLGVPLIRLASLRTVRFGIACALIIAGGFYAATNLGALPAGGSASMLPPLIFAGAVFGYLVMGVLINFGVGHYALSLVMFGLMGMDPHLVFPIMATAGVVGLSGVGFRYLASPAIDLRVVVGLAAGGVPAVLVAAFLVRSMPLAALRWLIVAVVLYTAISLIRAALKSAYEQPPAADLP